MNLQTLRPGLLVSLNTRVIGNAEYRRTEIEPSHITDEGTRRARWETEKVIIDPDEREKAVKLRSECRGLISRVCSHSTFGLLCPEDRRAELDEAIRKANQMTSAFNATASLTRVFVYVIVGRIAADDVEAVRAINSEVRQLLGDMEQGIKALDVKTVREAANKAKSIGRMLSPEAAERVKSAVDAAREVAKRIVKAGEEAGAAIDYAVVRRITESRTAFLDLEDAPAEVAAPKAGGRTIDLEPEKPAPVSTPGRRRGQQQQPQLEV